MTREELERRLDEAEKKNLGLLDEIKWLKEKLKEVKDEPEIPDKPSFSINERYWCSDFADGFKVWGEPFDDCTNSDFSMFHTREYAQEFAQKCKLIAMLLHCKWYICRTHEPNWDKGIQKWTVIYNHNEEKFTVESSRVREWSTIYFDTEENAQKCADWINVHWKESTDEQKS